MMLMKFMKIKITSINIKIGQMVPCRMWKLIMLSSHRSNIILFKIYYLALFLLFLLSANTFEPTGKTSKLSTMGKLISSEDVDGGETQRTL